MLIPEVLTPEEVDRLISAGSNLFEKAVPAVLYSTGALPIQLVVFRLLDIEWNVAGSRSGYISLLDDDFPLNQRTLALLRDYIAENPSQKGWVFEKPDGSPYEAEEILELLNKLAERAGLGKIEPATLRESLAVHLFERGHAPETIAQLLGSAPLGRAAQLARVKGEYEKLFRDPPKHMTKKAGK